jgi:hypothetical protein
LISFCLGIRRLVWRNIRWRLLRILIRLYARFSINVEEYEELWNKMIIFRRFYIYILWIYQFKGLIIRLVVDFRHFKVIFIRGRFIIRFINLCLFRLLFQGLLKLIDFLKLSCNYWPKFIHQKLLIFMLLQLLMLLIYFLFI